MVNDVRENQSGKKKITLVYTMRRQTEIDDCFQTSEKDRCDKR